MKTDKKILMLIVAITFLVLVCTILGGVLGTAAYSYLHPTHHRYIDRLIIGNTIDNIALIYGPFDYCVCSHLNDGVKVFRGGMFDYNTLIEDGYKIRTAGYELGRRNSLLGAYGDNMTYMIDFENNVATKVYILYDMLT